MKIKKCYLCLLRPATLPDRNRNNGIKFIKQICSECHAERLQGDMINIVRLAHDKEKGAGDEA